MRRAFKFQPQANLKYVIKWSINYFSYTQNKVIAIRSLVCRCFRAHTALEC